MNDQKMNDNEIELIIEEFKTKFGHHCSIDGYSDIIDWLNDNLKKLKQK